MKKKLIFIVPALFGIFLSACNSTSSESSISSSMPSSSENSSSDTSISSESSSSSSSSSSTTSIIEQYVVTFKDENGQILESKKWDKGSVPFYIYNKEDTPEYHFTFKGWSTSLNGAVIDIPNVSADATYYAVISKTKRSYNIKFCNENGDLIKSDSLEYGSKPSCDYAGPSDNQEFDYTFKGWSTSLNGAVIDIPNVSGDATYYAIVSKAKQLYVVNFYDENGVLIKSDSLEYGSKPSCDYTGPSDNQEFDYTFKGWAKTQGGSNLESFENVKENTSYYAVVDAVKKVYTISFVPNGGSSVSSIQEEYGTSIDEPEKPTRDGYKFVGWSINGPQGEKVTWPYVIKDNVTFYANWNEKVDIKTYFQAMMSALNQDPYSYIPLTMQPTNSANHVSKDDVSYDFSNFTNVSNIKYGGHGEQWHMVLDNINESQRFYSILTICETAINSSVVAFNNYLDKNPSDTASYTLKDTTYTASLDFKENVLSYTLQYNTNIPNSFFGDIVPQIDMTYDIKTLEKAVRIQLTETNAMRYAVKDNSYTFALKYGVSAASRNAYFEINRNDDGDVSGHIYEYVQLKDKDMIPACADFYIGETYSSVVGNKASGLVGFKGYINELYETSKGKLIGYEVRETLTVLGVSGQYNTLWFNLNDINGIYSVKAVENENNTGNYTNKNPYDIYLNGKTSIFEPTYNKKLTINTSRKYDVELRLQYFYGYENGEFKTYDTLVPMMFIQADNDVDSNFSDFSKDIASKSKINASVKLEQKYLDKIEEDYSSLIDIFVKNKDSITSEKIKEYIGDAKNIK